MKLIFKSLILLMITFNFNLYARDIIYIENQATKEELALLVKILEEKFNMPKSFITKRDTSGPCQINNDSVLHLCLRKDGSLDILKMESYVIDATLRTFIEMER